MQVLTVLICVTLVCISLGAGAAGPRATRSEMNLARRWLDGACDASRPVFSFTYDGKRGADLLATWAGTRRDERLDGGRARRTVTFTDPAGGLQVRCVAVRYARYPTVEWTVYLRNTGATDTPVIDDVQAIDARFERSNEPGANEFVLHRSVGSLTTPQDYRPFAHPLHAGSTLRLAGGGGRPADEVFPYFGIEWDGQGVLMALGWPGQWAGAFARDDGASLRVTAGQERTHFRLRPGEEVRTPLVALQFWQGGDLARAHNIWRRWMVEHNLPRQNGKLLEPVISACAADLWPGYQVSAQEEIPFIDGCVRGKLPIKYWWRDAGWYPGRGEWWNTGTWEPDSVRYPNGLREVADRAHAAGMKLTVWFEPERVTPGTWLADNHPEWVLGGKAGGLLDLGNPEARRWVTDHYDAFITSQRIDMYRQDFNMAPLEHWRGNDAPDRQGITENHHVQGLLAFWDELKRRHPGMPFDNCASGGRRNCLEMMRRGVPLSKSDLAGGTTSSQCQLMGIARWLPYYGAGTGMSEDPYLLRSNIAPWTGVCWDTRKPDLDFTPIRRWMDEWRQVSRLMAGDFYPLTPYSLDETVWAAWQFDVPETGEGVVQAFRRPQCPDGAIVARLRGLDARATYEVTDIDAGTPRRMLGRDLMAAGLQVTVRRIPWAAIVLYRRLPRE